MGTRGREGKGVPYFLGKSKRLLGAGRAADPRGLGTAGFGRIATLRRVGVFRVQAALDYGLAFLEVCLGCDGVVDLFVSQILFGDAGGGVVVG